MLDDNGQTIIRISSKFDRSLGNLAHCLDITVMTPDWGLKAKECKR